MDSIEIRQIIELGKGEGLWYISYVTPAPCNCYMMRKTIKITQKKKPTEKQIHDAIRNQRS